MSVSDIHLVISSCNHLDELLIEIGADKNCKNISKKIKSLAHILPVITNNKLHKCIKTRNERAHNNNYTLTDNERTVFTQNYTYCSERLEGIKSQQKCDSIISKFDALCDSLLAKHEAVKQQYIKQQTANSTLQQELTESKQSYSKLLQTQQKYEARETELLGYCKELITQRDKIVTDFKKQYATNNTVEQKLLESLDKYKTLLQDHTEMQKHYQSCKKQLDTLQTKQQTDTTSTEYKLLQSQYRKLELTVYKQSEANITLQNQLAESKELCNELKRDNQKQRLLTYQATSKLEYSQHKIGRFCDYQDDNGNWVVVEVLRTNNTILEDNVINDIDQLHSISISLLDDPSTVFCINDQIATKFAPLYSKTKPQSDHSFIMIATVCSIITAIIMIMFLGL